MFLKFNLFILMKYLSLILVYFSLLTFSLSDTTISKSNILIDNSTYTKININVKVQKFFENSYINDDMFLPSDLLIFLPKDSEFTLQIIQGYISDNIISNFYPFNLNQYSNLISDYPNGYFFISKNFSPLDDYEKFKTYFDVFSYSFKVTLTPLLDRADYILYKDYKILIERREKVCVEHLKGIRDVLSFEKMEEFNKLVDSNLFSKSNYKSIKYHVEHNQMDIIYSFEILFRNVEDDFSLEENKKKLEEYKNSYQIESNRYMEGTHFNFENFIFHHNIILKDKNIIKEIIKNKNFEIIEILPSKIILPKYSSMEISLYKNNKLIKTYKAEDLEEDFNIILKEKKENNFIQVPFSYESKISTQLNIKYIGKIEFDRLEISLEFIKQILNFESFDNGEEFGYFFPCGLIIFNNKFTITNYAFFNMPNIDVTMPFNIIAISWVIFGFMYVQILNIFLGKDINSKGLLGMLKDRFVAKWGFLWGRV